MRCYAVIVALIYVFTAFADDEFLTTPNSLDDPSIALASLEGEPSAIVHQCVNVITGDYSEMQTDLTIPGVEPLEVQRFYSSLDRDLEDFHRAWKFNHDINIYYPKSYEGVHGKKTLRDCFGAKMTFDYGKDIDKKVTQYSVHESFLKKRVTNHVSSHFSGRTHMKNKALIENERTHTTLFRLGSGVDYFFEGTPSMKKILPVQTIVKPNGWRLSFEYDKHHDDRPGTVKAISPARSILGSLQYDYEEDHKFARLTITPCHGPKAKYTFRKSKYYKAYPRKEVIGNEKYMEFEAWTLTERKCSQKPPLNTII